MPIPGSSITARAEREVTIRDFLVFQLKLLADGLKDVLAFKLSIVAIIIDVLSGRGRHPRLFYGVVGLSRRFESWLDLHRMKGVRHSDLPEVGGGLEAPDADELIGKLEEMARRKHADMRGRGDPP